MKTENHQIGTYLDWTNDTGAEVAGGDPQRFGGRIGIPAGPIAAAATGSLQVAGVVRGRNAAVVGNEGVNLYWDADGDPVSGDAGSGAYTTSAVDGDWWVGTLTADLAATDEWCYYALNEPNPLLPAWQDRAHFATAVDLDFVEATHSGGVIHVTADAKTVTLPTGVAGMEAIVVNDVADGGALVTVDLDGNEVIRGANLTIAATKTANNTKATAKQGDYLHLVCTVAGTAWRCIGKRGIWVTS